MSSVEPAPSISSERPALDTLGKWIRTVASTASATGRTRIMATGPLAYILSWLTLPLMNMLLMALIYRDDPELRNYAIVASTGVALLFGLIFNGGEMLDQERVRGMLGSLFLAPVPRFVWLGGLQAWALLETILNALLALAFGVLLFNIELDINILALLLSVILLAIAMWGASLILTSIGLYARNANFLSNLIFPILTLVAGTMYPVDRMSDWIRIPARCLPFAYGNEALVASLIRNASVLDLAPKLLPLAGFSVLLPVLGVLLFRRTERAVRSWGTLEIM